MISSNDVPIYIFSTFSLKVNVSLKKIYFLNLLKKNTLK